MTGGDGSPINLVLPGIFAGTVSAEAVATHTFPGDARVGRTTTGYANQSGNQISISFTTSCNLSSNNPGNPQTNPPSNPPSGGSLTFQIVSYDCNSGVLQYQMSGGDGSSISLTLPGIFAGNVSAGSVATHTFPGDARVGRTMSGYANQSGNQISINFTTSCNLSNGNPNPPPNNPPSNPPSGGSLAFQIVSYDCNSGILQYQFTSSNNAPVSATIPGIFAGTMNPNTVVSYTFPGDARQGRNITGSASQSGNQISISFTTGCNLSTTNPGNPPTNPPSNPPYSGGGLTGSLDIADCYGIKGWVVNRDTPHSSTKFDVYVNGWLAAANQPATKTRQDVANALGISGYNSFGFNLRFPKNYKTGQSLRISVKYAGTQIHITGSPVVTAACTAPSGLAIGNSGCNNNTNLLRSEQARSAAHVRTGDFSLQLSAGRVSSLTTKLIPVRAGDALVLDAYAYVATSTKNDLKLQIASALVGGVVAGLALTQSRPNLSDQRNTTSSLPTVGVGTALMFPLAKAILNNRLPKATMELAFYNRQGRFVYRQQVYIDKTARQSWQLLHIDGKAPHDGYVAVRMQNHSKTPVWFDDIWFQATPQTTVNSIQNELSLPKTSASLNGFSQQIDPNEKEIYQLNGDDPCDDQNPDNPSEPVNGGWLPITVIVTPGGNYSFGDEGGTVFTPAGAPDAHGVGDTYTSTYTGVEYVWDGGGWAVVLNAVDVKGNPPNNPSNREVYVYFDPNLYYSIVYQYIDGSWTMQVGAPSASMQPEKNNLNQCNNKVYDKIVNANYLRSKVLEIIYNFHVAKDFTIIIADENIGGQNLDADASYLNGSTWQITLNETALANASQEYIAATIIHEMLHVYLKGGNNPDHELMAQDYVYPMANAIRALGFNITYENAVALAWGGLQQTQAWQQLVALDRVSGTTVTQAILTINAQYKAGLKGLPCSF